MSTCTSCHQGRLTPTRLSNGLFVYACSACEGYAIDIGTYLTWRQNQPKLQPTPEAPSVAQRPSYTHQARAMRCPACRRLMSKHTAHAGDSPDVNTCLRCDAIWLETGVWSYLQAVGLHTSLTTISTTMWQNRRSHLHVQLHLIAEDRKALGETVYQQTQQIAAWLQQQPQQQKIFKLLQRLTR